VGLVAVLFWIPKFRRDSVRMVVRTLGRSASFGAVGLGFFLSFSLFIFFFRVVFLSVISMQFLGGKDIRLSAGDDQTLLSTRPFSTALEVCNTVSRSHGRTGVPSRFRSGRDSMRFRRSMSPDWSRKAGHGLAKIYQWRLPLAAMREEMILRGQSERSASAIRSVMAGWTGGRWGQV
jgi:hypothetical protein